MNSFGTIFRLTIFGESHGAGVGIVLDGVPVGTPLSEADFVRDMERRRAGAVGTTPRVERDAVQLLSGICGGLTTGAPLTIWIPNENTRSDDYAPFATHWRPSHADFVALKKYGEGCDLRGGGRFSGRMTAPLVAAGVVAKRLLPELDFSTTLTKVGHETDPGKQQQLLRDLCLQGDSVGGEVECLISGAPVGWGEPFFDSLEGLAAHLLYAIPGVRGVAFGEGFDAVAMRGSEHNDPILNSEGTTATNHAGGVVGGISNGNPIRVKVAFKPTASIAREQLTYSAERGGAAPLSVGGRHDACIAVRGAAVVEAVMAIVLADLKLRNK